jgi:hypothetical protein
MNEIRALMKEIQQVVSCPFYHVRHNKKFAVCEPEENQPMLAS